MKKFILINSPIFWDSTKENEQYLSPLGLGYIATYLEKINDIDVEIVDCVKDRKSVQDIISYIDKTKPDFVGINILILRILKTGISLEAMPPWVSENGFSSFQAVC